MLLFFEDGMVRIVKKKMGNAHLQEIKGIVEKGYTIPCANIASATLRKPAILAPFT